MYAAAAGTKTCRSSRSTPVTRDSSQERVDDDNDAANAAIAIADVTASDGLKKRQTLVVLSLDSRLGQATREVLVDQAVNSTHESVLRFFCPVFTLCSLVKMISMSCKSHTEVFARSLHSKLQILNNSDSRLNQSSNDASPHHQDGWGETTHDNNVVVIQAMPGTTFPPRTCAHFDLMRAKYHSESDLAGEAKLLDLSHASRVSLSLPNKQNGQEDNDSDLFFDFDIGSPEDDDGQHFSPVNRDDNDCPMIRHDSEDSDDSPNNFAKLSTGYGSASSGLCSDMDGTQSFCGCHEDVSPASDDFKDSLQCLVLQPQEWILQQQQQQQRQQQLKDSSTGSDLTEPVSSSSTTPIAAQSPLTENFSIATPDSLLEEPVKEKGANDVVQDNSVEADKRAEEPATNEEERDTSAKKQETICIFTGQNKHEIAHSKLNALIALLEKDKEYRRTSSITDLTKVSKSKDSSPNKELPGLDIPTSPSRRYRVALPTLSDSPANFSFLSSSVKASKVEAEVESLPRQERLARCLSTPVLTSNERAFMESPKAQRRVVADTTDPEDNPDTTDKSEAEAPEILEIPEHQAPLRRASSLKTGKTPPGTPGRRKIVRFADVFGLDLADVRTFLDEVPRVPRSAYKDLKDAELSDLDTDSNCSSRSPSPFHSNPMLPKAVMSAVVEAPNQLVPMFNQPGSFANFFDILREKKVSLENAFMVDQRSIKGTVRVQNLGFHKSVTIRYTFNEWISQSDVTAEYIPGSCDGFSDKFTFFLATGTLTVGQRVQFCIRYDCSGTDYWDSNDGKNYVFQCVSKGVNGMETANNPAPAPAPVPGPPPPMAPSSAPVPLQRPAAYQHHNHHNHYSHSPSALSEEPWLQYL